MRKYVRFLKNLPLVLFCYHWLVTLGQSMARTGSEVFFAAWRLKVIRGIELHLQLTRKVRVGIFLLDLLGGPGHIIDKPSSHQSASQA